MNRAEQKQNYQYDAFISYSHNDIQFARQLQENLEKKYKKLDKKIRQNQKRLVVCRDETDLTASPDLWPAIEDKIKNSRELIVICSAAAKESRWVSKEIQAYRENHSTKMTDSFVFWRHCSILNIQN